GNIFVKDFSSITMYNINSNSYKRLWSNYIMEGAVMDVFNNEICVAGGFGVIKSGVYGPMNIQVERIYPNTKNIYYNYITDLQVLKSKILLNTDRGTYAILVNDSTHYNANIDSFNLIIQYENALYSIKQGDTVHFSNASNYAEIDVIKPTGTGVINVEYSINNTEYTNSGY